MPSALNFFDLYQVYAILLAQVRPHVGAAPARDFGVEINIVRATLFNSGILHLLIDVQPTSELTDEQLRGLVFLVRDARQRGGICVFSGGGPEFLQALARFGFAQPGDWFPTQAHALAAIQAASAAVMPQFVMPPPMPPAQVMPPTAPPPPSPAVPKVPAASTSPPAPPATKPVAATKSDPSRPIWVPPPRGRFFPAHELTLRAHHRQPVLEVSAACSHLAECIRTVSDRFNFAVWAFVFMPDHFHLLVQSRQLNYDIGVYLDAIKAAYQDRAIEILAEQSPQVLNRLRSKQGGQIAYDFWQRTSGQNRNVEYTLPVRPLINHLHHNPVRRGLVADPLEWKWSSAGAYAGRPLAELRPDAVPPELLGE
ncbi:MAG: transposase [Planctomycetaceae bacterium]|nr:transposase [Planctomycetaceae bacterium]